MSEGTSLLDQAERLEMEFSRQVVFAPPHFSQLTMAKTRGCKSAEELARRMGEIFSAESTNPRDHRNRASESSGRDLKRFEDEPPLLSPRDLGTSCLHSWF
ncbi:hypothetical protein ILYODFUR_029255 [Ilyodon furcidens]|uniref:Uncharacterized protein n=1 Tax=Ilyodon furcidens TaxID=33524 RepID=A0ABV0TYN1_9TELE